MSQTLVNSNANGVQFQVVIEEENTDKLVNGLAGAYYRGLIKIGMQAVKYAKQLCPVAAVNGGRLRNSITSKVSGNDVYIGSPVHYAKYVECGTGQQSLVGGNPLIHGMRPQPFLKPAATEHSKEYGELLKTEVAKIK